MFNELLEYPLRSGVTVAAANRGSGIKMLNMGELFKFPRIPNVEMARVDLEGFDDARTLLRRHDLMFARRSLTLEGAGKCSIVEEILEPTTWEGSIIRARIDPSIADARFYFYYFNSPVGRRQMETIVEQVAAAGIRLTELGKLVLPFPSIESQHAIAEVLGALDDKIAANTKLAAKTDEFLAAQLSSSLREGHEVVPLATIATVNQVTVKPELGGQIRYIDIAAVGVGMHEIPALIAWEDAPSRARRRVNWGDTVWSTVRPNRRSHSLNLSDDQSLVGSTGLAVLTPTQVGFAYLYEVTRLPDFTSYLETVAEGSAYPAVRADRFGEAQVPLLGENARHAFELLAAPMRKHIHALGEENRTLAATRDALLPQLMSGALRVKDAEKVLEGVF